MTLDYELVGTGREHIIAMHDWTTTRETYAGLHPFLDRERFTYAFPDHRGYGGSREIPGVHTAVEAAADMLKLADTLGWDRFHILGHSMSGLVAQRVTLDYPDRVASMVAVTPVPASCVPVDPAGAALFAASATDDESWKTVSKLLTGGRLTESWYDLKLRQFRAGVDPAAYLDFLRMWTEQPFDSELRDMRVPTLVVIGEHDFEVFLEPSMRATIGGWYPDTQFEVISGAGHFPMAEAPVWFVTVVERFLRSVSELDRAAA